MFNFALFHGNILQGMYAFILGIILCILYLKTGSIWSNILCHIYIIVWLLINATSFILYKKLYICIYRTGLIATAILLISMFKRQTNSINSYNIKG
nr:CPBP family intramembrane metalloprotease [Clostridium sporogenes]